jgi:hypothetical protein
MHLLPLTVHRKAEKKHADLEAECSLADRKLHEAEASSSSSKSQLKAKQEELRGTTMSPPMYSWLIWDRAREEADGWACGGISIGRIGH